MMNCYEIVPGKLWQSGIVGELCAPDVDCVIDCTHDMDLKGLTVPLYVHIPFDDKPLIYDAMFLDRLGAVSSLGASCISFGYRVLTHCTAGINRSGLMNGLILLHMPSPLNEDVVDYIRSKRPGALTNNSFVEYLRSLK